MNNNFNEKQLEAINSKANVIVVIAGAGSGKTTVLIERISKLLSQGIRAYNVLAITFTNKAAQEMKTRLLENEGPQALEATIMTFHALCVKIIRENISHINGYDSNFLIIDEDDKKRIIKNILKENNLDSKIKVHEVIYNISGAKSKSLTYKNVEAFIDTKFKEIYLKYQKYCQKNNAFDFDDLLLVAYDLLKIKAIKTRYNKLFKYIHVDEFQDTSVIQSEILKKLKTTENNLFIVGDIDQSIYTWRGAEVDNLFNVLDDYPDVHLVKLEQNYRSTKEILNMANNLIENNKKRIEKELWTENKKGRAVEYYPVDTAEEEANTVVREINSIVDYGGSYNDFAVLYRYNYQSRKIEEVFLRNSIPYKIYGGIRFYERKEIKDILAYFRLFMNAHDDISLMRVINTPKRKIGEKTLEKYLKYGEAENKSLYTTISDIGGKNVQSLIGIIQKYTFILNLVDAEEFEKYFQKFLQDLGYEEYLLTQEDKFKVEDRMANIKELKEAFMEKIKEGILLPEYLNELSLENRETDSEIDEVILSTIHGVKGLEFDNVFIISLVEGRFPKDDALINENEMEEERRLAYVAITRAKHTLTLLSYHFNFKHELQKPSRFLEEMGIISEDYDDNSLDNFIF